MRTWRGKGLRTTTAVSALAVASIFGACGGNSENDGGDGDGSSSGTSGSSSGTSGSSSGGSSGASGSGGASSGTNSGGTSPSGGTESGGSPSGGSSGSGPTGGTTTGGTSTGGASGTATGGTSGSGGGGHECETTDDCTLFTDCCNCEAVPAGAVPPPTCDRVCITDQCSAQMIERDEVTCRAGRCVIDRSCNHAQATCGSPPPPCPDGQVRTVEDGCWGVCLPPADCNEVTDCADCGDDVCVKFQSQIQTIHCVRPGPDCMKGSYCECIDTCSGAFLCTEDDEGVACPCPVC